MYTFLFLFLRYEIARVYLHQRVFVFKGLYLQLVCNVDLIKKFIFGHIQRAFM